VKRRQLLSALASIATPLRGAHAQGLPRIGILSTLAPNPDHPLVRAFAEGLREHGLVDGQAASLEFRWAVGRVNRMPSLEAELAALPVDVIVTSNNFVTLAAKAASPTIPIVMVVGVDPVRNGLIDSFARPGRNITGLTNEPGQQVLGKMLELLREAVPRAASIGVLVQEGIGHDRALVAEAAARLNLRLLPTPEVRRLPDIEMFFHAIHRDSAQAYLSIGGALVYNAREQVAALALGHRLPGMHASADFVRAGGLMSYGTDLAAPYRRAAWFVARILAGAKPAELPIGQPTRFGQRINLRAAQALGLVTRSRCCCGRLR